MIFAKQIRSRWVAATAVILSGTASAQGIPRPLGNEGLQINLTEVGLSELAKALKDQALPNIEGMPLPDTEDKVDQGVEVKATGLKLWATFGELSLSPREQALHGVQQMTFIKIHADSIRMRKKVLGNWVSTTCTDTDIKAGTQKNVSLILDAGFAVEGRAIKARDTNASANIPSDDYDVDGPGSCSGSLGVGYLIRSVAHSILSNSVGTMEDTLAKKVKDLAPQLADALTVLATNRFEVEPPQAPGLPLYSNAKAVITTYPYRLAFTSSLAQMVLGVSIEGFSEEASFDKSLEGKGDELALTRNVGSLGINPELLTEAFRAMYPNGTTWNEIDGGNTPGISDILKVSSAAGIWPDLNEAPLSSPTLRLFLRLQQAPVFDVNDRGQFVAVTIPHLQMLFKVQIEGAWRDYFVLDLSLTSGLTAAYQRGGLSLSMTGPKSLSVGGHWADSYTPINPIFEEDVAELLFKSALDFIYGSGPFSFVTLPDFALGNQSIGFGSVQFARPYIALDLQMP